MISEEPDPLDGLGIGESVTVQETSKIYLSDLETQHWFGSDRESESRLSDINLRENEYGDKYLDVTVESEITRTWPRRWDDLYEHGQRVRTRREGTTLGWTGQAISFGIVLAFAAFAVWIATRTVQKLEGTTIEFTATVMPSFFDMALVVAFIAFLVWSIPRLPGMIGGRS